MGVEITFKKLHDGSGIFVRHLDFIFNARACKSSIVAWSKYNGKITMYTGCIKCKSETREKVHRLNINYMYLTPFRVAKLAGLASTIHLL